MSTQVLLTFVCLTRLILPAIALNPDCAPGGNFNLSPWQLQLPIGSTGKPDTESPSQLEGCHGYQDPQHLYFFTEPGDGALVMKVPGSTASSGCVTTTNSKHCRTEFREVSPSTWDPKASKNRLSVSLAVPVPDNSQYGTVIGQIHIDDSVSSKPVCELYYNSKGDINMGVEQTRAGGNEKITHIGNVPVNTPFSYVIAYENNVVWMRLRAISRLEITTRVVTPPLYISSQSASNTESNFPWLSFFNVLLLGFDLWELVSCKFLVVPILQQSRFAVELEIKVVQ